MNISLTPQLEELVNRKVESGLYNSASEVIREALRLLNEHDRIRESQILEMKTKVQAGVKEIRDGKTKSFSAEDIKAKGRERLKKASQK
jgi:antitoxin ParD1/3/4